MNATQKKNLIINVIYYALILLAFYFTFKYLLPILLPFVIGFMLASLARTLAKPIYNRFHLHRNGFTLFTLLLIYVVFGSIVVLIGFGSLTFISDFFSNIPDFISNVIEPLLEESYRDLMISTQSLPLDIRDIIKTIINVVQSNLSLIFDFISTSSINFIANFITKTPAFFVSVVFTVISSFFFAGDYDAISNLYLTKIKAKSIYVQELSYFLRHKVFAVLKAYVAIMSLTFIELCIGFMIIRLDNAFWIALSISIFDILPVFGTGGIMIPWALISLLTGNLTLGIELGVIYLIVTVVRNIIEPKIVGGNLGLHPVLTLAAMVVGTNFFGMLGLFGLPLLLAFLIYYHQKHNIFKSFLEDIQA